MVVKGDTRGNGGQLAQYLVTQGDNERVQILEVDGREHATPEYLHDVLVGMSLAEELTKSKEGLYHAQINPAYGEDRLMTPESWYKAVDILGAELGLEHQRRAIVLHEKNGRIHAHVVWERYDHDKGIMIDTAFNYKAHDKARFEMEKTFAQEKTPEKNRNSKELKEQLTELWTETQDSRAFKEAVEQSGYMLATGSGKRPFMVVDSDGRSFDLVRQLKGIRTKEVRERLRNEDLMPEKKAIQAMRNRKDKVEPNKEQPQPITKQELSDYLKELAGEKKKTAHEFAENNPDLLTDNGDRKTEGRSRQAIKEFLTNEPQADHHREIDERRENLKQDFADNRETLTREQERQKIIDDMKAMLERKRRKEREQTR